MHPGQDGGWAFHDSIGPDGSQHFVGIGSAPTGKQEIHPRTFACDTVLYGVTDVGRLPYSDLKPVCNNEQARRIGLGTNTVGMRDPSLEKPWDVAHVQPTFGVGSSP